MIDPRAKRALHTISAPRKSDVRDRVRKLTKLPLRMILHLPLFQRPSGRRGLRMLLRNYYSDELRLFGQHRGSQRGDALFRFTFVQDMYRS